jgi:N-acetylglutamate synthase-like GNAT family acetyltransferase
MTQPSDVTIRHARPEDRRGFLDFIAPFIEEGRLLPRTEIEFEELLPGLFIAELNGDIVGCAALEIYSRKLAEIRSLAVAESVRGYGVGKRLVNACLERANEREILEVMAITSSEDFFRACGFDFTLPGEKKALFYQTRESL